MTTNKKGLDWEIVGYHFKHSTYIDLAWNWFLELAGKLAAPFLLLSVLYAGLKVSNPNFVTTYLSGLDVFLNIAQNLALDMGGLGLFALAKQAKAAGNTDNVALAQRVGATMFTLMIVNLTISSLSTAFHWQEQDYQWLVGILLVVRAILAVLYGKIIHDLSSYSVNDHRIARVSNIERHLDEFTRMLRLLQETTEHHFQQMEQQSERTIDEKLQLLDKSMRAFIYEQKGSFQYASGQQAENLPITETSLQEYLDERLASIISALQDHAERLTRLSAMMPTITEDVTRAMKVTLEQHTSLTRQVSGLSTNATARQSREVRVRHFTGRGESARKAESCYVTADFERKAFVYACLQEDPGMTIAAIQSRAASLNQSISIGSISGYRKAFFEDLKAEEVRVGESHLANENEE